MQQSQVTQELNKWFQYVQYGQYQNFVYQQAIEFLTGEFKYFAPTVESMQFPGDMAPANLLMFKGAIQTSGGQFKLKIILVNGYPFRPPKVYID